MRHINRMPLLPLAALVAPLAAVPARGEQIAVAIPSQGNALGQNQSPSIYIVDTTAKTSRLVATLPTGAVVGSLQYNPGSNTISYLNNAAAGTHTIVTLNAQTGQVVSSTTSPGPFANSAIPLNNISAIAPVFTLPDTSSSVNQQLLKFDERLTVLEQKTDALDDKIGRVGAMAAALSVQRPAPGKTMRLGLDTGFFDGKSALAVNGSAFVAGSIDIGAGVAFSGRQVLGKAGIGFNW